MKSFDTIVVQRRRRLARAFVGLEEAYAIRAEFNEKPPVFAFLDAMKDTLLLFASRFDAKSEISFGEMVSRLVAEVESDLEEEAGPE